MQDTKLKRVWGQGTGRRY